MLTRPSTTDLNDGRNSLGIYETISFIQEGASRHDLPTLKDRTTYQYLGIKGLVQSVARHADQVLALVTSSRAASQPARTAGGIRLHPLSRVQAGAGEGCDVPVPARDEESHAAAGRGQVGRPALSEPDELGESKGGRTAGSSLSGQTIWSYSSAFTTASITTGPLAVRAVAKAARKASSLSATTTGAPNSVSLGR